MMDSNGLRKTIRVKIISMGNAETGKVSNSVGNGHGKTIWKTFCILLLLLVLQVLHKVLLTVRIDYHSLVCKHVVQSGGRIWKLCAVALGDNYRHL